MFHAGSPQRGLTLVEVILVVVLLVVIGAISAPLLGGAFSRAALHSGGDLLRGAWSKARLAAMQSGQTYAFRFEPDGSRFQIIALNRLGLPEAGELPPDQSNAGHEAIDMLRLSHSRLPDGVVFTTADVSTSSLLLATIPQAADSAWSTPILFHADGTTSDASVLLSNKQGTTIRVTLRGLTGISNVTDADPLTTP